jgi:hypothetical protein
MNLVNGHVGELALRRRRAGEAVGNDGAAIDAHAAGCAECRARLRALDDEQHRFEDAISFDRFEAGVARAAREAARRAAPAMRPARRRWWHLPSAIWLVPAAGMAAALALMVTFSSGVRQAPQNRIKGGAGMLVRIAGHDGQRTARIDGAETLAPGERLRIGYQAGEHRYLLALSIDDRGEVTALYPESGASLPVVEGGATATRFLPDSIELTGKGAERIVVVLSDAPLAVDAAKRAARAAYDRAGGDLARLPALSLPGEQFVRTFAKP